MRRRELIAALGGAMVLWPAASGTQQQNARRLGVLLSSAESDPDSRPRLAAFREGLQDLGWHDGENIHIDYRWGDGQPELIRRHAQELVASAPEAILANGTPAIAELKPLTRTIPIVCALVIDPVGLGLVNSLAHPGGNITGFSFINAELFGKWTALLKDAAPNLTRAALLYSPGVNPWYVNFKRELAASPRSLAMPLIPATIDTEADLQPRIEALGRTPETGVIIGPDAFILGHLRRVAALLTANRLPAVSVYRRFAVEGGLMSYGPDVPDIFLRAAGYVDRILKGANPAELPVQEPSKFQSAINQKAAAMLGLTLSPILLAGADEVIE